MSAPRRAAQHSLLLRLLWLLWLLQRSAAQTQTPLCDNRTRPGALGARADAADGAGRQRDAFTRARR